MTHPIDVELANLSPDAPPYQRLDVVWNAYEVATSTVIGRPPSAVEREAVSVWLRSLKPDPPGFILPRRRLGVVAGRTVSEKAASLYQLRCGACEVIATTDSQIGLSVRFPIAVEPWSAQSTTGRLAIRDAVNQELRERGLLSPYAGTLCIGVLALVPRRSRVKDSDNLVKGLLDSMQGVLYTNDTQIQCLISRRVEYAGTVGNYLVRADGVYPWDADVVFDDPAPPTILSGRRVHITRSN